MRNFTFILLFVSLCVSAQKSVNDYKYILVSKKFDFLKKENQYQTSSLTKFLFNKYGFIAFLADEKLPEDLSANRCLALTANLKDNSGMLTTKNSIELKDCRGNIVYTSSIGKSKNKDYKRAYHESIRNAFTSIQRLRYRYTPKNNVDKQAVVIADGATSEEKKSTENVGVAVDNQTLYAQPIKNGYQLVNTKPEKVYELLKTSVKDVFVLKNKNGILYKSGNAWIVEYYQDGTKILKKYTVKF